MPSLPLELLAYKLAITRLEPSAEVPAWASEQNGGFLTITRTPDELSIVCADDLVPESCQSERAYQAIRVAGTLDFSATGILNALSEPLAKARIPIFVISTFDTDYILVKQYDVTQACDVLQQAGHHIRPTK